MSVQQFCRTSVHNCNAYAAVHFNDSRFSKMEEDQDMLQACVEDLTAIIDKDGKLLYVLKLLQYLPSEGDGDISREEFVKNATNSKFISNLLSK